MVRIKIKTILYSILLSIIWTTYCHAIALFDSTSCISMGSNADPSTQKTVVVRPVGNDCYNGCQTYCAQYFKIDFSQGNDTTNTQQNNSDNNEVQKRSTAINDIMSANGDRIEQCLSSCYSGKSFSGNIRVPMTRDSNGSINGDNTNNPYPWACDIPSINPGVINAVNALDLSCNGSASGSTPQTITPYSCSSTQLSESFVDANIAIKQDSVVNVKLINGGMSNNGQGIYAYQADVFGNLSANNIYMCGFKTFLSSPQFISYDGNNASSYNGSNPVNQGDNSPQNSQGISAGIYVQEGDYLSIEYFGRYHSNVNSNFWNGYQQKLPQSEPFNTNWANDGQLQFNVGGININTASQGYILGDLSNAGDTNGIRNDISKSYCGSCATSSCPPECSSNISLTVNDYGMSDSMTFISNPNVFTLPTLSTNKPYEATDQFRTYTISGTVKGAVKGDLIINYPKAGNTSYGGYFVKVTWRGCNYNNGNRLQYKIINDAILKAPGWQKYVATDTDWNDVIFDSGKMKFSVMDISLPQQFTTSSDTSSPNNFNVTTYNNNTGKLYFRIKPLTTTEQGNIKNVISSTNPYDVSGSYSLFTESIAQNPEDPFSKLVNYIQKMLKNIPENIFDALVKDSNIISVIKILLVLYIAITGILFMVGLAPINQQEGVTRILKLTIVLMLITDNSWKFFHDNFLGLFTVDILEQLANTFTPILGADLPQSTQTLCQKDPTQLACMLYDAPCEDAKIKLMCLLTKDLSILFSTAFWQRILGLLVSGFWMGAIAVIVGVILYGVVLIKILLILCMSLVLLTVVLSLAPIFICFLLFKYTRTMFDQWLKQLMVIMLQPIALFAAISIFRAIFNLLIEYRMGFFACKTCWLNIIFPIGDYCLFGVYAYVPFSLASSPGILVFMSELMGNLAMFFVGYAMYTFCDFAGKMMQYLIAFNAVDASSTGITNITGNNSIMSEVAKPLYNAATAPVSLLGLDDKSRTMRKNEKTKRD